MDTIRLRELKMEIFQDESTTRLRDNIRKWRSRQSPETMVKNITQSSTQHCTTICIWYIVNTV